MSKMGNEWSRYLTEKVLISALFFIAYWSAFKLQNVISTELEYTQGVSLVFLPAGVKLLAILLGGVWGLVGVALAAYVLAIEVWNHSSVFDNITHIVAWLILPYMAIKVLLFKWGVSADLAELTYPRLLVLTLVFTSVGAVTTRLHAVMVYNSDAEILQTSMLAMAFGDFVGVGIVVGLTVGVGLLARRRS